MLCVSRLSMFQGTRREAPHIRCGLVREYFQIKLTQTCANGAQMRLRALVPCTLLQHQACQSKIAHKWIKVLLLVHVSNLV